MRQKQSFWVKFWPPSDFFSQNIVDWANLANVPVPGEVQVMIVSPASRHDQDQHPGVHSTTSANLSRSRCLQWLFIPRHSSFQSESPATTSWQTSVPLVTRTVWPSHTVTPAPGGMGMIYLDNERVAVEALIPAWPWPWPWGLNAASWTLGEAAHVRGSRTVLGSHTCPHLY